MMAVCPRARVARVSDLEATLREALTCGFAQRSTSTRAASRNVLIFARGSDLLTRASSRKLAQERTQHLAQVQAGVRSHLLARGVRETGDVR